MDIAITMALWTVFNLVIVLSLAGVGIYVLLLVIKALKIYINKNS